MEGNRYGTKKSKKKRIRRLKRRLFRIFVLTNMILAVCVTVLLFRKTSNAGGQPLQNKKADEKLSGTDGKNEITNIKYMEESETVKGEKLTDFKSQNSEKSDRFKTYTVCLDAGHGGNDVGAEGEDGSYEKNQVLKLSYLVKNYLEAVGVKVVMTRKGDETVSLEERRNIAENCNADLLLSIHRNVYEGKQEVNGIEAWINNQRPQDATKISENILKNIERKVSDFRNRGVKWGSMDNVNENYGVNKVSMASLILEVGFITSTHDNKLFNRYLDDIAWGIAQGVLDSI